MVFGANFMCFNGFEVILNDRTVISFAQIYTVVKGLQNSNAKYCFYIVLWLWISVI